LDAFAADPEERIKLTDAASVPVAHVAATDAGGAVVAYELNGFEGSREEVLKRASRLGKAANVFWNVDGLVTFACARRGRVLCWVDLLLDEHPEELPASLRRLLPADRVEADLVAVGAAMIEVFTGVTVLPEMISANEDAYVVRPRVEELALETVAHCGLGNDHPELVARLADASGLARRAVAEWSAEQALRHTGLNDDPAVASVISQFGGESAARTTPAFTQRVAQIDRDHDRAETRYDKKLYAPHDSRWVEELEYGWATQRTRAVRATRYACSDDDLSAALGAVHAAACCFAKAGAEEVFAAEVARLIAVPRAQWPDEPEVLPAPLSAQQRADALDWATWKPRYGRDSRVPALELWERGHQPLRQRRLNYGPLNDPFVVANIEQASEQTRREIARWAAHLALQLADLHTRPWVAPALSALDNGQPLPAPFDDPPSAWARLAADPEAPNRLVASLKPDEHEHQESMALPVLAAAVLPDATQAALNALWYTRLTAGSQDDYYPNVRRPLKQLFGI
jgi:hypothetical protein